MRKLVFFVFISIILFFSFPIIGESRDQVEQDDIQVIPDEAIRLRILAHSDGEADQEIKRMVRDQVNKEITAWVNDIKDIQEARNLIQERVPEISGIVDETLKAEGKSSEFEVEYSENVSFPAKLYGSYLYPAGEYEAVLITIGEGKGSNWWCVLFPPLCFLDFGNGTSVSDEEEDVSSMAEGSDEDEEEVEVKFFLFEWLGWS